MTKGFLQDFWVAACGVGAFAGGIIAVVGSVAIWTSAPQAAHQLGWTILFGAVAISLPALVMAPWLWMVLSTLRTCRR
jgi:hypothetical protein